MHRNSALWAALAIASAMCVGCAPTQSQNSCDRAVELMAECGRDVSEPIFDMCNEVEQEAAAAIVAELEPLRCHETDAKSSYCGRWDPIGLCGDFEQALGPDPSGEATRYPIILAHGFNTSTRNFWRFNDVDILLKADGHDARLGNVPPFDTPQVRAGFLATQIDALVAEGHEKVNLLCFSMGGIDCRYLASPQGLDYGSRIASITLLSAPNRGTAVADWAVAGLGGDETKRVAVANWLARLYGIHISDVSEETNLLGALQSMSKAGMSEFNQLYQDPTDVYVQSWAGFSAVAGYSSDDTQLIALCTEGSAEILWHEGYHDRLSPLFTATAPIVSEFGREWHDGVATVRSAKWGTFRGCIPADHLDQVGQINDSGPDKASGFDYKRWFRNWAYDLAARGY